MSGLEGIQKGERLAILDRGAPGYADRVEAVQVERLTPTQVVVSRKGRPDLRYYLATGRRVGDRGASDELVRWHDPRVIDALAATSACRAGQRIAELLHNRIRTKREAIEAMDQAQALVTAWWEDL